MQILIRGLVKSVILHVKRVADQEMINVSHARVKASSKIINASVNANQVSGQTRMIYVVSVILIVQHATVQIMINVYHVRMIHFFIRTRVKKNALIRFTRMNQITHVNHVTKIV